MRKIIFILLFAHVVSIGFCQDQTRDKLVLYANLSELKEMPVKVLVEKTGLGGYDVDVDTCYMATNSFRYELRMREPAWLTVTFYWKSNKLTSTSFWATADTYELSIDQNLKPARVAPKTYSLNSAIIALLKQFQLYKNVSDSLVNSVSYENLEIAEVEKRIDYIRDSVDLAIDEHIYLKTFLANLNTPLGLYALCKYAERPYSNQRIKSKPDSVAALFNLLNLNLKSMPSAKLLLTRIKLGKSMLAGEVFKDISLPDTIGKSYKISDFRGKYVLVDFWASWCVPCRNENPNLLAAFKKYKNSGFQIIGISRDEISLKENWLDAIKQDGITLWPQLSDFNDIAQKAYGIRFLPTNYLLDPKGVIIGRDLNGEQLNTALKEIFKQ